MNDPAFGADAPVYVISVAAELAGMHPQTLRQYDRLGIVSPGRTSGRGRRYSMRDVRTLREVQRLSQEEGINLAGIKRILELQHEVEQLREQAFHLANELEAARRAVSRRGRPARPEGGPVRGELVRRTRVTIFNTAEPDAERPDQARQGGPGGQSAPGGQGPGGQGGGQGRSTGGQGGSAAGPGGQSSGGPGGQSGGPGGGPAGGSAGGPGGRTGRDETGPGGPGQG